MKLSTAAWIVLCWTPLVGAQVDPAQNRPRMLGGPTIKITDVETTMAYEPGGVAIRGTDLGLVRQVRINGVSVPIIRRTEVLVEIEPRPQDPGFARLELVSPLGIAESKIEFTPSLQVSSANDALRLTQHGGEPGPYWIHYSLDLRPTPNFVPGIYYAEMLNMTSRRSGLLARGFSDGSPITLSFRLPPGSTFPIHFQSLCSYEEPTERYWSFSNAFTQP